MKLRSNFSLPLVAKFKFSSITQNVSVFMSEDDKVSHLIQTVADDYNLKVSVGLQQHSSEPSDYSEKR